MSAVDDVKWCSERVTELQDRLKEALGLLLESEFWWDDDGWMGCEWCKVSGRHNHDGVERLEHKPDCRWLAVMRKAGLR